MSDRPGLSPRQGPYAGRPFEAFRFLAILVMALGAGFVSDTLAQSNTGTEIRQVVIAADDSTYMVSDTGILANRDSLMVEIRKYSRLIAAMQDSLSDREKGASLTDTEKEMIVQNIDTI